MGERRRTRRDGKSGDAFDETRIGIIGFPVLFGIGYITSRHAKIFHDAYTSLFYNTYEFLRQVLPSSWCFDPVSILGLKLHNFLSQPRVNIASKTQHDKII